MSRRESRDNPGIVEVHNLLNYMPNRGDFDKEYDYDLENVIAELEFFSDDDDMDRQYKDNVIQYYLNR